MPPGFLLSPDAWRGVTGAAVPGVPNVDPHFTPNAEPATLPEWNLFGAFGKTVGGYPIGANSPATWNPRYAGPTFGNAPPGAVAAGMAPSIAPQEEAAPGGAAPGEPVTTGPPQYMPSIADTSLSDFRDVSKALSKVGGFAPYDKSRTTAGVVGMLDAGKDYSVAQRAEAGFASEQNEALSKLESDRSSYLDKEGDEDSSHYDREVARYGEQEKKHAEDDEWLREHSRVDPYRKFTTNAGAGILALLGTGLMATGASMRNDTSMEWTKQVDNMLDREADQQMKMIKNKQFSASETGRNMERILSTSKDRFEARTRYRNQHLAALNAKAEAIAKGTESKAVKARAEAIIANNNERISKGLADIGIREQGHASQEAMAMLANRLGMRAQDVQLYLGIRGDETQRENALVHMRMAINKPIIEAAQKIKGDYADAATAAVTFRDLLARKKRGENIAGQSLDNAAAAYVQAANKFRSGGSGPIAGIRDRVATYTFPTSPEDLKNRLESLDPQDIAREADYLEQMKDDKINHLYTGHFGGEGMPSGSLYTAPPPAGRPPAAKAPTKAPGKAGVRP